MKKIILLLVAPFVMFSTLSAQITQQEADKIVKQRLDGETKPYTVYAKEDIQAEGFTVETATGETLALEYPCWVYFVSYTGETIGKYLIVKTSNGNLLEINTKKDTGPGDLPDWRLVIFEPEYPIEIPFTEYSLEGTSCRWTEPNYYPINDGESDIINSRKFLDGFIVCNTGNYPEIDFDNYSLLLVTGSTNYSISNIKIKSLQLLKPDQYELSIDFKLKDTLIVERWLIALVVPKMSSNSKVALNLTRIGGDYPVELPCEVFSLKGTLCRWEVFPKHQVFLINSNEDLENYIYCFDGIYPVIDFENYTMLLVCGIQPSSDIFVLNAFLFKYEPVEYVYRVEILVGLAGMPGVWWSAILIKKIPEDTIVQFDIVKHP